MNHALITSLVAFNANLQIAHWQATTVTNEHAALGELYGRMLELTDEFAEVAMGRDGNREFPAGEALELQGLAAGELLEVGLELLAEIREDLAGQAEDLGNLVAEMSAAINRTRYRLQKLKG